MKPAVFLEKYLHPNGAILPMGVKALIVLWCLYSAFWKLGSYPLAEWDEARYGVNAVEMMQSGNYGAYTYNHKPDLWSAKPGLSIWLITASYRVFGFNEWGLRIPSAAAGLFALVFLFLLLRQFVSSNAAWLGVFMASTCKALFGYHVGRNGDMDTLFVMGLVAFTWAFCVAVYEKRRDFFYVAALSLGVAFYAKGFALLIWLPGAGLILLAHGRWALRSLGFYGSLAIFSLFPASWAVIVNQFGYADPAKTYQGGNAFVVMIVYDVWARFTGKLDAEPLPFDPWYLNKTLDLRFSSWFHFIAISLLSLVAYKWIKRHSWASVFSGDSKEGLILFLNHNQRKTALFISLAFILPVFAVLFVSNHKLEWYMSPILPGMILLVLWSWSKMHRHWPRPTLVLVALSALMAAGNQINYVSFSSQASEFRDFAAAHTDQLQAAQRIFTSRRLKQDEMLYLSWKSKVKLIEPEEPYLSKGVLGLECGSFGDCVLSLK
jgi:4-amino-4-deoxy-L-arabinose transferase-like glycosyltransferase